MRIRSWFHEELMQKKYNKHLQLLPFLFTFANAFLGFIAIVYALEANFTFAVYSIMLAALMDMCDGRLARALGTTSMMGQELDSLADGISFGLAPCVVLYTWYPGVIGCTGFIALGCYLSAGLYRLARFNLTAPSQHLYSLGLPIPVAAFFVSNLVLYHEWILEHRIWFVLYKRVPFIVITFIAALMVSSISFPSFKQLRFPTGWYVLPFAFILWISLLMLFMRGYPLLLLGLTVYIGSSILHWLLLSYGFLGN